MTGHRVVTAIENCDSVTASSSTRGGGVREIHREDSQTKLRRSVYVPDAMLLAIDLGNTNLTFGLFADGALKHTFRAETAQSRTADEYAALIQQLLIVRAISPKTISAAILASVVPRLTETITSATHFVTGCHSQVVTPSTNTGIELQYDNPQELGADRIVNAVAAFEEEQRAVIVVDFGTATKLDCVTGKGEFIGGVITPGIQVSFDALTARAAKLTPVDTAAPPTVIGRNTAHAMQSGAVFGHACMVDGLVERMRGELAEPCAVLATGGLAQLVAPHAKSLQRVDQSLTLRGLEIIHRRRNDSAI